jgi:hypothetical protein
LQQFYIGKRPKLALVTGPQHDKSLAATDFAAWVAASFSEEKSRVVSLSLIAI